MSSKAAHFGKDGTQRMKILSGCLTCNLSHRFESSDGESCGDVFSSDNDELSSD